MTKEEKNKIIEIISQEIFAPDCPPKENSEYHLGHIQAQTEYAESKLRIIKKIEKEF